MPLPDVPEWISEETRLWVWIEIDSDCGEGRIAVG